MGYIKQPFIKYVCVMRLEFIEGWMSDIVPRYSFSKSLTGASFPSLLQSYTDSCDWLVKFRQELFRQFAFSESRGGTNRN